MTAGGTGDAGALTIGLRREVTGLGLQALATKALHVAVAAPDRMIDIYDNAAAGWLSRPVFHPRLRSEDPLPISAGFWKAFWELVNLPPEDRRKVFAERTLRLAGELNPRINARMAVAALEFPGVAEAAARDIPEPYDLEALTDFGPATLGYALRQAAVRADGFAEPLGRNLIPLLRHMPPPLGYINIQVIQTLPLLGLVGGYSASRHDQVAKGGFLMGQVGHHYSALYTAITLAIVALERPKDLEVTLDSIFKGWTHGRETPPLIGVAWEEMFSLRVDQVREALGVAAFDSPFVSAVRQLSGNGHAPPRGVN